MLMFIILKNWDCLQAYLENINEEKYVDSPIHTFKMDYECKLDY